MPRYTVILMDAQTNKTHEMGPIWAENRIQAGGWARTAWAEHRGEDYDPNVHKVLEVKEVTDGTRELF